MNREEYVFWGFFLGWASACCAVAFFQLLFL